MQWFSFVKLIKTNIIFLLTGIGKYWKKALRVPKYREVLGSQSIYNLSLNNNTKI